jgi:N-acetylglucosaminyl-diphospho-decaprenol L-rhamnosyltransferase
VNPSIDVVIPVHDSWRLTKRCLERLQAQTLTHTVIVCDNGSTDETVRHLRAIFPDALLIELGANVGFSAACNRGAAVGTAEIVVLLNNDVECPPDFLENLVAPLVAGERLGSVSPLLLRPGEERIDSFGLAVDATLAGYPRFRGLPCAAAQSTHHPTLVGPTGAAGAYRRRAWEIVGGLDEGVFAYGEDVDLALRLHAAGWATAGVAAATAIHVGSASAITRSPWQRYQGGFSRGYFLRRYGILRGRSAPRALATEAIAVGGDALFFSHDLAASRGRIAGWRAARDVRRVPYPSSEIIAHDITFTESLRLRRSVYGEEACT